MFDAVDDHGAGSEPAPVAVVYSRAGLPWEPTEIETRLDAALRNFAVQVGATQPPTAEFGVEIEVATDVPALLSDAGLIDAVVALQRQVAFVQARQALVLAEFARRRPDTTHGNPFDIYAADEIALALTLASGTAATRLDQAVRLSGELAATREAWVAGLLDERKVAAICQATQRLDPEIAARVQDRVLPKAPQQTLSQLWAVLKKAILAADPEGANERYRKAVKGRRVDLYPEDDGMAVLAAMLPAQDALACYRWLTRLAHGMSGDPRGLDQRRADLLVAYLSGQLGTIPAQDRAAVAAEGDAADHAAAADPADEHAADGHAAGGDASDDHAATDRRATARHSAGERAGESSSADPAAGGSVAARACDVRGGDDRAAEGRAADDRATAEGAAAAVTGLGPSAAISDVGAAAGADGSVHTIDSNDASQSNETAVHNSPGATRMARGKIADHPSTTESTNTTATALGATAPSETAAVETTAATSVDTATGAAANEITVNEVTLNGQDTANGHDTTDQREVTAWTGPPPKPVNPGKPLVNIVIPHSTLRGAAEDPGHLAGYGPIAADQAREIAGISDALWRRLVTDPLSGALLDHGEKTYRPSAAVAAFVRARDVECRSPICRRSAWDCELDHIHAWADGGTTTEQNLMDACPHDHRCKYQPGWQVRALDDGRIEWRTPTGHAYFSEPFDYRPDPPSPPKRKPAPKPKPELVRRGKGPSLRDMCSGNALGPPDPSDPPPF